ncbi:hypothetical protein ABB37_07672, partial [Leptomonas pyrrhocoris]
MAQLYVHYASHVADVNATLPYNAADADVRASLSRLYGDGLSQVVSFMDPQFITRHLRTLSAVCPQMRLDTEALTKRADVGENCRGVVTQDNHLIYRIASVKRGLTPQRLAESLWWADRCGLPLTVTVGNERRDVLASLTDRVRDRVEELQIYVDTVAASVQNFAAARDGQCGNFLCALLTFPNMTKLLIACSEADAGARASVDVNHALQCAAQLPISQLCIRGFMGLTNLSALAESQHLQHLTATRCRIQSVTE